MPAKRANPSSSSDLNVQRPKRQARTRLSPHEKSDSSGDEGSNSNDNGVNVTITPTTIPPLEATTPQLPKGEGATMVLQAVHLIKGLNAEEIALLRANRQQLVAYNREKGFPLNQKFSYRTPT